MNENGALSQDEIDALLTGTTEGISDDAQSVAASYSATPSFKETELSNIIGLMDVSLANQTDSFQEQYNRPMVYSNIKAFMKDIPTIRNQMKGKLVQLMMNYEGGIEGEFTVILQADDAIRLAEIASNQTNLDFNESTVKVISETIHMMFSAGNEILEMRLGKQVFNKTPIIEVLEDSKKIKLPAGTQLVEVSYNLNPENMSPISIHQFMPVPVAKELINISKMESTATIGSSEDSFDDIDSVEPRSKRPSIIVRPVAYQSLNEDAMALAGEPAPINMLMDISMQLSVELGRTQMQVKEILALGFGSIIELEKLAGEPVDLLVNRKLIAKGEVVVIDEENFGVRVTEIVNPHERSDPNS